MIKNLPDFIDFKIGRLLLLLAVIFTHTAFGQGYNVHNWYFGNSPYGLIFNKSDNQPKTEFPVICCFIQMDLMYMMPHIS
jgi:hypothetical protein